MSQVFPPIKILEHLPPPILHPQPETFETVFELNHQFHLRPGLYLTPLAQYIHAPGSTSIPDTLALGLQLTAIL